LRQRLLDHDAARPCPCGDKICKKWVINYPELRLDTEAEAKAVADLLNDMQRPPAEGYWILAPLQPTPEMLDAAGIPRIAAIGVWTNMIRKAKRV
jgi:hypothetical protein